MVRLGGWRDGGVDSRVGRWLLPLALLGGLAGCGDETDNPDLQATIAASASPTIAPAGNGDAEPNSFASPDAASIGDIVWATELESGSNQPVERVTEIPSDAMTIYAVLPVSRIPVGTVVRATWIYNETSMESLATETTVDIASDEMIWIEFHLTRDGDEVWPDGTYVIEITLGDSTRRVSSIDVVD